jgi:hypothetical protein
VVDPRGARGTAVFAAAVLGAASFLGACASPGGCAIPASTVISMEVFEDGSVAVRLDRSPERALAAARAVCKNELDLRFSVEWSRDGYAAVRIAGPMARDRAESLAMRIAKEAERR